MEGFLPLGSKRVVSGDQEVLGDGIHPDQEKSDKLVKINRKSNQNHQIKTLPQLFWSMRI